MLYGQRSEQTKRSQKAEKSESSGVRNGKGASQNRDAPFLAASSALFGVDGREAPATVHNGHGPALLDRQMAVEYDHEHEADVERANQGVDGRGGWHVAVKLHSSAEDG